MSPSGSNALQSARAVIQSTARGVIDDKLLHLSAALSYYALLSMAPLFLVITSIVGLMLDDASTREVLIQYMGDLVGDSGADLLRTLSSNVSSPRKSLVSMSVGVALILVGATTVFAYLQFVLNRIWQVEPIPTNAVFGFVRARLIALAVVLGVGFLLLVSLILSAVTSGLTTALAGDYLGAGIILRTVDLVFSITFVSMVLALLFRYVPDVKIHWPDAWFGAVVTALLFTLGKHLIGLYLGKVSVGSAYGAAGSMIVFMVWVYYASLILFIGAELTKAFGKHRGHPIVPNSYARLTQ